jgi:hypothetical protein
MRGKVQVPQTPQLMTDPWSARSGPYTTLHKFYPRLNPHRNRFETGGNKRGTHQDMQVFPPGD